MSIRTSTSPNMIGKPNVPLFNKSDLDAVIWQKGYDIIIEHAIECPCKGASGSPKTTCNNCLGTGYVFISPVQTKALITSINKDTRYKYWSPELTGTVNVTVRDEERLSYMDKITFITRTSIMSEIKRVITVGVEKFIFVSYKARFIKNIFLFNGDQNKLIRLNTNDYLIKSDNNFVVKLNVSSYPVGFNNVVSIEYEHELSYNVIDLPHDFRSTFISNNKGQNVESLLPIQAVARRSHIILGVATNLQSDNIIDNNS